MLDHQYSVYQTLLRVPLIVRAPGRWQRAWRRAR